VADVARLRSLVLVHYHELGLKRGNRPLFLRHLARNLRRATGDLGPLNLRQVSGRVLLELDGRPSKEFTLEEVRQAIRLDGKRNLTFDRGGKRVKIVMELGGRETALPPSGPAGGPAARTPVRRPS